MFYIFSLKKPTAALKSAWKSVINISHRLHAISKTQVKEGIQIKKSLSISNFKLISSGRIRMFADISRCEKNRFYNPFFI